MSAALLLAIAACCPPAASQDTQPAAATQPVEVEVVNEEHGFRFKIPARFQSMPAMGVHTDLLHAFVLLDGSAAEGMAAMVQIQRMRAGMSLQSVGGARLPKGLLPGGAAMETRKWQGRDVPAMVLALPTEGGSFRTVSVEVPLGPRIMVMVSGDASRKAELEGYLAGVLNSLQGQAAPTPAGGARASVPGPLELLLLAVAVAAILLIVSVIVVIVIVVATRSKRRRSE